MAVQTTQSNIPLYDYVADTGYFKIDTGVWFKTSPADCELTYEYSFTTSTGTPISETYGHIFTQSFYTPEKIWVKTAEWQSGVDENRYYGQVRAC